MTKQWEAANNLTIEDKQRREQLSKAFHNLKVETVDDIVGLIGRVLGQLADDIVDHKKAHELFNGLFKAASLRKDFLTLDFPQEVIDQANKVVEDHKQAVIQAHKTLLCPECYKKVRTKLGWLEKPTT